MKLISVPFAPVDAGKCVKRPQSGRNVCYPRYEDLDTSCTDVGSGLVAPPAIKNAIVLAMAFVPPDTLRNLMTKYYRIHPEHFHEGALNTTVNSFLFVRYHCEEGYQMADDIDTMFCSKGKWVNTEPYCIGTGLCAVDNGGCSHTCRSDNNRVTCSCPKGLVLSEDEKTCRRPIPSKLCRSLSKCVCTRIDSKQFSCNCPPGETCLSDCAAIQKNFHNPQRDIRLYISPSMPYEVRPGGNINITCSAVSYPFPRVAWQHENKNYSIAPPKAGSIINEQVLFVSEITKTTNFTCHATNGEMSVNRTIQIVVKGPGDAPRIKKLDTSRTSIRVYWTPPTIMNNPITNYIIYYSTKGNANLNQWKQVKVDETTRDYKIENLLPRTQYYIRLRALDSKGEGKVGLPIKVTTRQPARQPIIVIEQGSIMHIPPLVPFNLTCKALRTDPMPRLSWQSGDVTLASPKRMSTRIIVLEHGVRQHVNYTCRAVNEAGRIRKRIQIIVTGPLRPDKPTYVIHGNNVYLSWETPQITNGPMKDYEVLYTDDPSLPDDRWHSLRTGSPDIKLATISNLKEFTPYSVKIRGWNELGPGEFHGPFNITTQQAGREPVVELVPSEKVKFPSTSEEDLMFRCEANGVPKPEILWYWNENIVEHDKDNFRIYDATPYGSTNETISKLVLEKVTHSGTVRCEASNEHGIKYQETVAEIMGPGSPPRNIRPYPYPNGFKVTWEPPEYPNGKIDDYVIFYAKDPETHPDKWNTTVVDAGKNEANVTVGDEDTSYSVRMQARTNDHDGPISEIYDVVTGKKIFPLEVQLVILDPKIDPEENSTTVSPMQSIKFKCVAKGHQQPLMYYSWLQSDNTNSTMPVPMVLSKENKQKNKFETVLHVTKTPTAAELECLARDRSGLLSDRHHFNVLTPGSPPEYVSAFVDKDNTVTVTWEKPKYPNGPIIGYNVYITDYISWPQGEEKVFNVTGADNMSINFKRGQFEPSKSYFVKVAAVGPGGEGLKSDPKPFMTEVGGPLNPPTNLDVNVLPNNSFEVSWKPPTMPNGPIKEHTVYFTLDEPPAMPELYKQWEKVLVPGDALEPSVIIDNADHKILPNKPYIFVVSTTNDQAEGQPSTPVVIKTQSGRVKPTVKIDKDVIKVDPHESVTIHCEATGIPPPKVFWVVGLKEDIVENTNLTLDHIVNDETAKCVAENGAGRAQSTVRIIVSGPGTPPNEIFVIPQDDSKVNVEWTTPDTTNGKILGYEILYGETSDDELMMKDVKSLLVDDDVQHATLTNLKPKTDYAVKVRAISDRGPGVVSKPYKVKTLPLAPSPVEKPEVTVHDNNTVVVSFEAPNDPQKDNDTIKEFLIRYKPEGLDNKKEEPWHELIWREPDNDSSVEIKIGSDNFKPNEAYALKIIPRGEVDGPESKTVSVKLGSGVVPPATPVLNVDATDNAINVPAGTDYTVTCSASGSPTPKITWHNENETLLSESSVLKLTNLKETVKAKCVAKNEAGKSETPFTANVIGPGDSPNSIHLTAEKPRTINVKFDPPRYPNGNLTQYVAYYLPLDNQSAGTEMEQVQQKPLTEWNKAVKMEDPEEGEQKNLELYEFVEPDTDYAVVLQAVNEDGPGPHSEVHFVHTMSKNREQPPKSLHVEPLDQRSELAEWEMPEEIEKMPIGYELFYTKAGSNAWEDGTELNNDWKKISIMNPKKLKHKLDDILDPDTEYMFKIRALYSDGPGVFSDACISRTLPEGGRPYIILPNGEKRYNGTTTIDILPGSSILVFCNAKGKPSATIKWVPIGVFPNGPSWVEADKDQAKWSLEVTDITNNASFKCIAQNQHGSSNWTINFQILKDLAPDWKAKMVTAKNENGSVFLDCTNMLPKYFKDMNNCSIQWTPSIPAEQWNEVPQNAASAEHIPVPEMEPGNTYYVRIKNPTHGITSPVFQITAPKPASDIRLGTNLNGELVLDFKPPITAAPVEEYLIKYWPLDKPDAVIHMESPANSSGLVIIDDLIPDQQYKFMVIARTPDGNIASEPVQIKAPQTDIQCPCSICVFEDINGTSVRRCICPYGFKLAENGRDCEQIEESGGIIHVTEETETVSPSFLDGLKEYLKSTLPTITLFASTPEPVKDISSSKEQWIEEGTTNLPLETARGTIKTSITDEKYSDESRNLNTSKKPEAESLKHADLSIAETPGREIKYCDFLNSALDVVFVVDIKGFAQEELFYIKTALKEFISKYLDISPDVTRVALIKYDKFVEVPVALGGYEESNEIYDKIEILDNKEQVYKGDHHYGINSAYQQFRLFPRENAGKIILVIAKGSDKKLELQKPSANVSHVIFFTSTPEQNENKEHVLAEHKHIEDWHKFSAESINHFLIAECEKGKISLVKIPPTSQKTKLYSTQASAYDNTKTETANYCQTMNNVLFIIQISTDTNHLTDVKKKAILQIIKAINTENTKVGIIKYASTAQPVVDIGNYATTEELNNMVENLRNTGKGDNGLQSAWNTAIEMITEKEHEQQGKNKATIIILHDTTTR
uniref:Fibronectin type-III domain-containing protein n=1 Tax=Syphacia muris TaxID=451379 RepID=A0A0N5A8Q4_9BILA